MQCVYHIICHDNCGDYPTMSSSMREKIAILVVVIVLFACSDFNHASQYDPHPYPSTGPFFEGWYTRIVDTDNERSLGLIFGRVLRAASIPTSNHEGNDDDYGHVHEIHDAPATYIGLVRSNGDGEPLVVVEAYPNESDIEVTVRNGQPVTEDPSLTTPPCFQWRAKPYGFFNVTQNSTFFNVTVQGVTLVGNFSGPVPWDSTGRGPEGWLTSLPFLPLHWFVYSLGTSGSYVWTEPGPQPPGAGRLAGMAHAHQEKNWGTGFPPGWVWTQGYNRTARAAFAGTFGMVSLSDLVPSDVPAHLFGYLNAARNLSLDFRPDNSITIQERTPCEGKARIRVLSARYSVELSMTAPVESFRRCLRGPVEAGFEYNLVETYSATIRVVIRKLGWTGFRVLDDQLFTGAAFEFGRDYLCHHNACNGVG